MPINQLNAITAATAAVLTAAAVGPQPRFEATVESCAELVVVALHSQSDRDVEILALRQYGSYPSLHFEARTHEPIGDARSWELDIHRRTSQAISADGLRTTARPGDNLDATIDNEVLLRAFPEPLLRTLRDGGTVSVLTTVAVYLIEDEDLRVISVPAQGKLLFRNVNGMPRCTVASMEVAR